MEKEEDRKIEEIGEHVIIGFRQLTWQNWTAYMQYDNRQLQILVNMIMDINGKKESNRLLGVIL